MPHNLYVFIAKLSFFCTSYKLYAMYRNFFTVVRDQDGHIYFRENNGRLLAGGFEPIAKPAYEDGKIPGK